MARVLAETGIEPAAVVLERTESIFLQDSDRAAIVLGELKDLGVTLALDDFGTGCCSLTYLRNFPADILKIDRSFTATAATDPTTAIIVESVITLAHNLGLTVVAEGVETSQQHQTMLGFGWDTGQGSFTRAPLDAADFALPLSTRTGHHQNTSRLRTVAERTG